MNLARSIQLSRKAQQMAQASRMALASQEGTNTQLAQNAYASGALSGSGSGVEMAKRASPVSIFIHQTDPFVKINLPSLQNNYTNIAPHEDVMYQLEYYDFPNDSITLYPSGNANISDIGIAVECSYSDDINPNSSSAVVHGTSLETEPWLGSLLPFTKTSCANAVEVAMEIKKAIQAKMTQLLYKETPASEDSFFSLEESAFLLFCLNVSDIYFDSQAQKYAIQLNEAIIHPNTSTMVAFFPLEIRQLTLKKIRVAFRISPVGTAQAQLAAANLMGADTVNQRLLLQSGGDQYAIYEALYTFDLQYVLTNQESSYFKTAFGGMANLQDFSKFTPALFNDDYVYIRSNGTTAITYTNQPSSFLAIVPRNRNFGDSPNLDSVMTTNIYAVQENLGTMRNLKLEIVDAAGRPIYFNKPFTLKIAIFYS